MENTHTILFEETKKILEKNSPETFNLDKFILDLQEVRRKVKEKQKTWTPDEWDNWYSN
jgi:hypothetical protein